MRCAPRSLLAGHTDTPRGWQDARPKGCAAPGLLHAMSSLPSRPGKIHVPLWFHYKHMLKKQRFGAKQHHRFSRDERRARCTQQHPDMLPLCTECPLTEAAPARRCCIEELKICAQPPLRPVNPLGALAQVWDLHCLLPSRSMDLQNNLEAKAHFF